MSKRKPTDRLSGEDEKNSKIIHVQRNKNQRLFWS